METTGKIACIIVMAVMGAGSIIDFYFRKIPLAFAVTIAGTGIVAHIWNYCTQKGSEWRTGEWKMTLLTAFIPGLICLLISAVTGQVLGYGDSLMILALGTVCTMSEIISIGMIAISTAGMVGLVLLVGLRKEKDYELPFLPFLWLGYLTVWACIC